MEYSGNFRDSNDKIGTSATAQICSLARFFASPRNFHNQRATTPQSTKIHPRSPRKATNDTVSLRDRTRHILQHDQATQTVGFCPNT
jgi:hypothetical protein